MVLANSTVVAIGTFTPKLFIFAISPLGAITSMTASKALVPNQESLLIVPDPHCDSAANIVATNNNCAVSESNTPCFPPIYGISAQACCSNASMGLVTSRLTAGGDISIVSRVAQPGQSPIHMAFHPSGSIAIANYVGGTADLVGPFDPTTGTLGSQVLSTRRLSDISLMHMVNSDKRCGTSANLVGVDADYHGIVIIDPGSAAVKSVVRMRERPRRLLFHPTLQVAYAVFEEVGQVAVFSWPACEAWLSPGSTASPPTELQAVDTHPADDAGGLDIPTSLLLSPDGLYAYSCTATLSANRMHDCCWRSLFALCRPPRLTSAARAPRCAAHSILRARAHPHRQSGRLPGGGGRPAHASRVGRHRRLEHTRLPALR